MLLGTPDFVTQDYRKAKSSTHPGEYKPTWKSTVGTPNFVTSGFRKAMSLAHPGEYKPTWKSTVGTPNFVTPGFRKAVPSANPGEEKSHPRKSAVGTTDIKTDAKTRNHANHLTTPRSSDGWAGGIDFNYNS